MKHIATLVFLLFTFNVQAALNKWVDAEGKVHYSDSVPPDVKVTKIRSNTTQSATESEATSEPKSFAEKELEWKKSQEAKAKEQEKEDKAKEVEAVKQRNCEKARRNLTNLENSPAIVTYNEKGERNIMDDTSRNQRIDDARKNVSNYCN